MSGFLEIRLTPIKNGTVLDHLPVGSAQHIVSILSLDQSKGAVTIAINTESKRMNQKDLLFIENRELSPTEIEKIGLVANNATWNTIRDGKVVSKAVIPLPKKVEGILPCPNKKCISAVESIPSKFFIKSDPLSAACFYCERILGEKEIASQLK